MSGPDDRVRDSPTWQHFHERALVYGDPVAIADWTDETPERRPLYAEYARHRAWIHGRLSLAPGMRCLDAGCGAGGMLLGAQASGAAFVGFDFCESMVRRAREFVPWGRWAVADMTRIPFRSASFDRVLNAGALQYLALAQARSAVVEMCRVCRPGGIVCVTCLKVAPPGFGASAHGGSTVFPSGFPAFVLAEAGIRAGVETTPCLVAHLYPQVPSVDAVIRLDP